jgi:TRAP-type C4-dicarboxylate transport system permease small subunit
MLHKTMMWMSRAMAIAGGIVLVMLICMVGVSIIGRTLNGLLHVDVLVGAAWAQRLLDAGIGPVTGDFELVEAGMAFTIFSFLPLCQITGAHATVDIFTSRLPPRLLSILRAAIEVLFAVVLGVIALQLLAGTQSKLRSGQTTFLIQFPLWWAYGACLMAAGLAAVVGTYTALCRVFEAATGRPTPLTTEVEA